ncbi:MAG TPA: exopolysaccharide biosynthesis polyprenyl glycosylphosphotransferase [Opitutaceae bacterium]|nr:exopolysaccharide biosynthesis polyprenyl glycosylphosphotransferase [Opitutaceae bacterium]
MNTRRRTAPFALALADVASLVVLFNVIAFFRGVVPWNAPILAPLILPCVFFLTALYLIEGYNAQADFLSLEYASQHIIALVLVTLATLLATFVVFPAGFSVNQSRSVIVLGYLTLTPLSIGYRRMWHLRAGPERRERTLVFVGDAASCREFQLEAQQMKTSQPLVLCALEGDGAADPTLANLRATLAAVATGTIDPEALVLREANPRLPPDISDALLKLYFAGVPIYTLELFHETYWRKIPRYRLNQIWLFQEGFQITREPVFAHAKRLADLLLAALGLLLAIPVLAIAALAIWVGDRGPVFFAQTRIGRNRVPFRMFKLRTMRPAATGDAYTREGDDRVTRVGRFLRVSRIDEIPQLWNVLRGEMSLIGPRAEWDRLVSIYENEIPCYHFRHLVKPGITGWAQVNYPYGANLEDTVRKLEYDLYYIRHFSFFLDAAIVLKTIHTMLFGKGR